MKSYLTHLECTNCGATHSADQLIRLCTECGKVLYARYDLDAARRETDRDSLEGRRSDMWRYFEMMPVLDEHEHRQPRRGHDPHTRSAPLGRGHRRNELGHQGRRPKPHRHLQIAWPVSRRLQGKGAWRRQA